VSRACRASDRSRSAVFQGVAAVVQLIRSC
jgi:hypothetical protein